MKRYKQERLAAAPSVLDMRQGYEPHMFPVVELAAMLAFICGGTK